MSRIRIMIAAAAAILTTSPAFAQSSKVAWNFDNLISVSTKASTAVDGQPVTDTGWQDVLTTYIKTPNAKELAIGASLQCGLVTDTTVRSKNGDLDAAAGRAKIAVRVAIFPPGVTEPIFAAPSNGGDLPTVPGELPINLNTEGVTYCDRYQMLAAKFAGLNCTADLTTGVVTCADPEELRLLMKTLDAHHFNFLYANATPGVHKVVVQARAQAGTALGGVSADPSVTYTPLGAAGAEAFIGAGALSVETIRLVKDADGTQPEEIN